MIDLSGEPIEENIEEICNLQRMSKTGMMLELELGIMGVKKTE